jgi:BRCT domain type II-containing protein
MNHYPEEKYLPFAGKKVAFTGTLKHNDRKMLRKDAEKIVKALGGCTAIAENNRLIGANTLIVGTQVKGREMSTKEHNAWRRHNMCVITAEEFFQIIAEGHNHESTEST